MSHDKKALGAGCLDSSLRLIRVSGEHLGTYKGHLNREYSTELQFGEDDNHLLTSSEDGAIYIYNVLGKSPMRKIQLNHSTISCLQLAPNS